jgi:amidase
VGNTHHPTLFAMIDADLLSTSALQQAELIRQKQISPIELLELYLARIDRLDPQIGAFFHVAKKQARQTAKAQTKLLTKKSAQLPPLFGLPMGIKDLNPVAGMPCSYGVAALKEQPAVTDDSIVLLLNQAGCNILGKTAISELAALPFSETPGFAPTRNPWNLAHTAGGSSGGAAAAVAAGMLPFAHGDDGGGSLRGPAHCCGLVGIKPTRGRVSDAPVGDRITGLAARGPIARNVSDAAALLDAMAQRLPGDPYLFPAIEDSFLAAAQRPPGQLKIAVCKSFPPFTEIDVTYSVAIDLTADLLSNLGHQISEIELDIQAAIDPFITVWQTAIAAAGVPAPALGEFNQWLISRSSSAADYLNALYSLQAISRQVIAHWQEFDVLLAPVYLHSTIAIGAWADLPPQELLAKICDWTAPCPLFNATGQPVIVLPVALEPQTNLPIGIQLVGNLGAEAQLISLAAQLEQQLGKLPGSIAVS